MGLILVWRWVHRPSWPRALRAAVWGGVSLACLALWVAWAFGSIPGMLAYFAEFSETYAGGGLEVRAHPRAGADPRGGAAGGASS